MSQVPEMMRTAELVGPEGLNSLKIVERPTPVPGPNQVLVRVRATSLNYRDILMAEGRYGKPSPKPLVPLSDGAGEVAAVGTGVKRFKPGDRVAAIFMQTWLSGPPKHAYSAAALGGAIDGMLSEYVALHEDGLVAVPEHLSFEETATLPCAGVTAWNALAGNTTPGDIVLVQGTGGVSVFALQLAKIMGARVIATSSSDDKLQRMAALGASDGINYRTTPDWDVRARELTAGSGVDHVVEVGGSGTLSRSLNALNVGGVATMIGVLAGGVGEVTTGRILSKSLTVRGIYVGSREMFESLNRALVLNRVHPVIDKVFPFEEAHEAYLYMKSQQHLGKVVIRVGS